MYPCTHLDDPKPTYELHVKRKMLLKGPLGEDRGTSCSLLTYLAILCNVCYLMRNSYCHLIFITEVSHYALVLRLFHLKDP